MIVFEYAADPQAMTHIMCLNCAFREMVEEIRYRSISLEDDRSMLLLCSSLSSCRSHSRASIVQTLHMEMLNLERTPYLLQQLAQPSILNRLQNLRSLSLTVCACGGSESERIICNGLAYCRFPRLRVLKTNLDDALLRLTPFFATHRQLEELDLESIPFSHFEDSDIVSPSLVSVKLPSLHTLTTPFLFLKLGLSVPQITRLRLLCDRPPLRNLAKTFGGRLVSLRLHAFPLPIKSSGSQLGLQEVRTLFPRLRYLQVDMLIVSNVSSYTRR